MISVLERHKIIPNLVVAIFTCLIAFHLTMVAAIAAEPLKIGTTSGPIADIIDFAAGLARQKGQDVQIVEFSDWVAPNEALQDGAIDANLFQHIPFLNAAIAARGYDFKPVASAFVLTVGLFSKKIRSIDQVTPGATVAIANDPVNGARGLLLFEKAGLIKLRDGVRETATIADIVANPKKLNFTEVEAPLLPRALDDVEVAQVSISYLIAAGGDPETALITDGFGDKRYALQFVTKSAHAEDPRLRAFVSIYQSPEVKNYIQQKYGRYFVPAW